MHARRSLLVLCASLSLLTIVAVGLSHLALTDIAQGEADLSAEWAMLRLAGLVFLGLSLSTLVLVLQVRSGSPSASARPWR